jgi:hypothetical protein
VEPLAGERLEADGGGVEVDVDGALPLPAPGPVGEAPKGGAWVEGDDGAARGGERQGAAELGVIELPAADDGQVADETEAHGEGTPPGVDHRVRQDRGGRAGSRQAGPGPPGLEEPLEDGGVLEDRPEVERGGPREVEEAGGGHLGGEGGRLGVLAAQDRAGPDVALWAEAVGRPSQGPVGALVGGGRREEEDLPARLPDELALGGARRGILVAEEDEGTGKVADRAVHGRRT